MTNIDDLDCAELKRVVIRDRYMLDYLSQRLSQLTMENATLMAVIQETQQDLAEDPGPPPSEVQEPPHVHPPEVLNSRLHQ